MTNKQYFVTLLAIATIAILVIIAVAAAQDSIFDAPTKQPKSWGEKQSADDLISGKCQEDMPCWDCETMGNLLCGEIEPLPTCASDYNLHTPEPCQPPDIRGDHDGTPGPRRGLCGLSPTACKLLDQETHY